MKVRYDLPDITNGIYTFTDGVGHCSQALLNRCSITLGWRQTNPSAVQVRIGGSKGVLTVVPDSMIEERTVRLRKSMMKFKSGNEKLNVLKIASYGVAFLNRQAILLLEAQGVPSHVLLRIFENEKARIEGLEHMFDGERLATLTTFPLARAISTGFTQDPLVQNMLRVLKCRLLGDLKWKARILIPDGAYLMGVADETRTLRESEVFCQIEYPSGRRIIAGTCTIYRNPCLHPGDIRLVKAVDNPALSHLKNVIVFPTVGPRDLPSMMGGGDLDGDHYTLLWDHRLIIPREHEPMDYSPSPPNHVPNGQTITVDDTKNFWVEYIMNDILGMVCNAHMALADEYGPSTPDCLKLAALASQAVDFSKTGVPVDRYSYPRPEAYPDFMGKEEEMAQKTGKKKKPICTYKSVKVLGEMFRSIGPDPVFEPVELDEIWNLPLDGLSSIHCQSYLRQAALLKTRYDFELNGLLRAYNICEAECVAGVLLRSRRRRVRVERDHSLRVAMTEAYASIASSFISEAVEYQNAHPVTGSRETDRRVWALACYKITYDTSYSRYLEVDWTDVDLMNLGERIEDEESEEESDDGSMPASEKRYSFPWLFHEEMFFLAEEGM